MQDNILIVDDEKEIADLVEVYLKNDGYNVFKFYNATEALACDLKTPITSIIGYLTLLQDEPQISMEMRAKYTGIALDKAERLEDLINEFFDITRFNLSKITLELERVLDNLIRNAVNYSYRGTGLYLSLDKDEEGVLICVSNQGKTISPEKLENNPELLDFVSHYLEYEPVARGTISKEERNEQYPLFNQWDERWGYL